MNRLPYRLALALALALALLAPAAACGADADPPVGPVGFEVTRYDYRIDLSTLEASSELTLAVTEPGDCVTIPLRASGIDDVRFDGEPIREGTHDGAQLTVCGRGWEAGDEVALSAAQTVREETWGDSQVGYSVTTDLEGNPFRYLVSWVGGCDRFGPCDHAPDRFARYRFEVAHPAGERVLCPGELTPGDTLSVCEFDRDGGPTYSTFGLAAGPSWQEIELGDWGGVRAVLYDMPSAAVAERFDADQHAAFLAWMVERFGPYPYGDELRFAVGPTYWSGFEHPGNIVLYDRLGTGPSSYADPLAHTTNHELAHQWAGDQTTLADTYDFVWKEAMAEYLAFVFEDEELEPGVGQQTAFAWKSFSRTSAFHLVPGERPPLLDYYGDVYGPGPMILFRQLEALFSRDAVMAALADLLGQPRAISVEDVRAALEASTGADLSGYFDAWVYGEGAPSWPTARVTVTDNGDGSVDVRVDQVVAGDVHYGAAFAVQLRGEDAAAQRHDVWIDFGPDGAPSVTETATPGFPVATVVVDAYGHSLFRAAAGTAAPDRLPEPDPRNPWATRAR